MSSTSANFLSCENGFIISWAFRVTNAHFIREVYNTRKNGLSLIVRVNVVLNRTVVVDSD